MLAPIAADPRVCSSGSFALVGAHTSDVKTFVALTGATLLMTGCSGSSDGSEATDTCGLGLINSPAEVVSEPELEEVPEDEANLVLDLSSSTRESAHVTVRLNSKVALDVRTPAVPAECSHAPVYSHGFRLLSGSAQVTVTTDQHQRRSLTVPLHDTTRWVVVQPQDGFPVGLDAFDDEPAWG